jgi:hypothetical protein
MTWQQVIEALEDARRNPRAAQARLQTAIAGGEEPVRLLPDKPWDEPEALGAAPAVADHVPPLDSLTADAAYFDAIERSPLHGGLLDGLHDYYR